LTERLTKLKSNYISRFNHFGISLSVTRRAGLMAGKLKFISLLS